MYVYDDKNKYIYTTKYLFRNVFKLIITYHEHNLSHWKFTRPLAILQTLNFVKKVLLLLHCVRFSLCCLSDRVYMQNRESFTYTNAPYYITQQHKHGFYNFTAIHMNLHKHNYGTLYETWSKKLTRKTLYAKESVYNVMWAKRDRLYFYAHLPQL